MRRLFVLVTCLSLLTGCRKTQDWGGEVSKEALLREHNLMRHGSDLIVSQDLERAAQHWAEVMAQDGKLRHGDFQGRLQGTEWQTIAENIAEGQESSHEVVRVWMNSRGHRKNILNRDYRYVGFGIAYSRDGTIYWVADFGG